MALETVYPTVSNVPIQKPVLEIQDVSLFLQTDVISHISMQAFKGEIIGCRMQWSWENDIPSFFMWVA